MRADRLLAVLLLVQRRGRTTAGDLARRLEVSVRTIYRDLEALQVAGVPIYSEPGRNGGVRLVEGYRTDLSGLSIGEAELVPLLGLGDALAGMGLGSLAQTEAKVLAALPDAQRERAEHLRRRIHVDLSAWWHGAEVVGCMESLVEATFAQRTLRVRYRRGNDDSVVSRTLDPFGLVLKAGVWYLVGRASTGDPRTYRASRFTEATALDEHFESPATFDLAAFWNSRREAFQEQGTKFRCVVRARADAVRSLNNDYETVPESEWTRIELTFGTADHALRRVLALGSSVVVEEPASLRDEVTDSLRRTSDLYAGS